jgi:Gluconate 2-dehydrogenase subunit 3
MSEHANHRPFSEDQQRALAHVLDEIIPASPDGRLPGAGQLGLAGYIEGALRNTPALLEMIVEGLSALDDLARRRQGRGFSALPRSDRVELIGELASTEHAFPPLLILHAYTGYYQHARVLAALGLEPRPPHPKGFEMVPDDLTLLDPVRQRPRFYRQY